MRTKWTKEEAREQKPPVPVAVRDDGAVTEGRLVFTAVELAPWVVVTLSDGSRRERLMSWGAVLQALNEPGHPIRMDRSDPRRWVAPEPG